MPTWMPTVIGMLMCFVVPAISFAAGVWIERYGMPVEIRWRGRKEEVTDD